MKIKNVLVSQPRPESEKSPYFDIARNYKINIEFKQFIKVEGLSASDFRKQRIELSQYNCIILNSRNAVDHYFRIANELRYTVPEKNKYFCLTEAVALYLQKYIVYRKRKIFFAQQGIEELVDSIRKNKEQKFLLPCSDRHTDKITEFLDQHRINYTKGIFYKTVSCNMTDVKIQDFDLLLFFSPHGIQSLFDNFPNYKQGEQKVGVFGVSTYQAAIAKGIRVDLVAPMPQAPSMTMALEWFIRETNKTGKSPQPYIPVIPEDLQKESVLTKTKSKSQSTPKTKSKTVVNSVKSQSKTKSVASKAKTAKSETAKINTPKSAKKKTTSKQSKAATISNLKSNSKKTKPLKKAKSAVDTAKKTKSVDKKKVVSQKKLTTKDLTKKAAAKKTETLKKAAKKTPNKTAKKAVKKTPNKAVKKAPKKAVKKAAKKTPKKTVKKVAKKTPKKTVKKVAKKAPNKTAKKAVKKTPNKTVKKAPKKTAKKLIIE